MVDSQARSGAQRQDGARKTAVDEVRPVLAFLRVEVRCVGREMEDGQPVLVRGSPAR